MTYWDKLKATAFKHRSNGNEVLEIARLPVSTIAGIQNGATPKKKTLIKIEAALTIIGWEGSYQYTYQQAG